MRSCVLLLAFLAACGHPASTATTAPPPIENTAAPDAAPPEVSPAEEAADARAKQLYNDGRRAYDLGKFPEAIDLFRQAYATKADVAFLFNVGQALRLNGDTDEARATFQQVLALPEATDPQKAQAQQQLDRLGQP